MAFFSAFADFFTGTVFFTAALFTNLAVFFTTAAFLAGVLMAVFFARAVVIFALGAAFFDPAFAGFFGADIDSAAAFLTAPDFDVFTFVAGDLPFSCFFAISIVPPYDIRTPVAKRRV
ncbi:MAG: hypothetical protein WCK47_05205 [bacterium]